MTQQANITLPALAAVAALRRISEQATLYAVGDIGVWRFVDFIYDELERVGSLLAIEDDSEVPPNV